MHVVVKSYCGYKENMEQTSNVCVYRKALATAVSSILLENGIDAVEKECLGTLTEFLQCCKYNKTINAIRYVLTA